MTSSPPSGARQARGSAIRCPACGSRIRPEESWCSLCHHSLLAAEPAAAQPGFLEPESHQPESQQPESQQQVSLKKRDPAVQSATDPSVIATADRLIAELAAAEAARARESGLAGMQGRFGGRNGGVILAVVGGVLLLVIGILGLTLLGLLV